MAYINEEDKKSILDKSSNRLKTLISEFMTLRKSGTAYVGECPLCKSNKFNVNENKKIFKCWSCNAGGKDPLAFLMKMKHYTFPDALEYLAKHIGYIIEDKPSTKVIANKVKDQESKKSFCKKMIEGSGLTEKDLTAHVFIKDEHKTMMTSCTFKKGTLNSRGEIDSTGDDMIIEYYDLEGVPVMYEVKDRKGKVTGSKEYFRVRWQHPSEHKDSKGRAGKYKTPAGAGTFIYIPDKVREMYKRKEKISTLFIQEGEKKAEKACKHGLDSIAISGIQNLGQRGRLPEDLIRIIDICKVESVCFLLDSDWSDISQNIKINDDVAQRPRNFFYAVKNYKDYCRTLKNRQLYVEIYFGHVLKNDADDKGIDDLLTNTLAEKEQDLKADFDHLINEKDLRGEYLQVHKITTATDYKIEEFWNLHSPTLFAKSHYAELKDLPEFRIGKHLWRFDDEGEVISAQPIEADEQYWLVENKKDRSGGEYEVYNFDYVNICNFLQNRGFARYRKINQDVCFIHIDPPTVRIVEASDIRDYITDFTKTVANKKVLNMIYKGGQQYLGPDRLSNINFAKPDFQKASREKQMFYFKENCWEITATSFKELDYTTVQHHIWNTDRRDMSIQKLQNLIHIEKDKEGKFYYQVTPVGEKCHFLQFLINASNFSWRKKKIIEEQTAKVGRSDAIITDDELYDNVVHLVSKMCAIGYMMLDGKDRSNAKAVVAMDGKQSEVGVSNGRSGKSIIGLMLQNMLQSFYINGKVKDLQADNFVWNDCIEGKKVAFIDDVRPNFDFEFLFANITGDWNVNYKGGSRATFSFQDSPKIYLTTNHALNGDGSSFMDRQWLIAFSDFYNGTHKPKDDFGVMFFDEWDNEQWTLHWNLIAACVQAYLQFGVVESPGERLETRRLRQQISESFIIWADEYFSDTVHLNQPLGRKSLYDAFLEFCPEQRKWTQPTGFKKKLKLYCQYKEYVFNPQKYDKITGDPCFLDKDGAAIIDDKKAGVEYFTIGNNFYGPTPSVTGVEVQASLNMSVDGLPF